MHVNQKILHKFVTLNRKFWIKRDEFDCDKTHDGEICCVHGYWTEMGQLITSSDMIAKSIQRTEGIPISSVVFGHDYSVGLIDGSYGIETNDCYMIWISSFMRLLIRLRAFLMTIFGTGRTLIRTKYRGAPIGDLLYDNLQRARKNVDHVFDMRKLKLSIDYERLCYELIVAEQSFRYVKTHSPKYVISRSLQGTPGIFVMMCMKYGATFISNVYFLGNHPFIVGPEGDIKNSGKIANGYYRTFIKLIDSVPEQMLEGTDPFVVKNASLIHSKEEITDELHLNPSYPCVVILPHCLGDSPRNNSINTIYMDYNEWLVDTMETISHIDGVNWIIKDHPYAKAYAQDEYIYDLFLKYNDINPNIKWMSKGYGGENIYRIADVVLADNGEVGCEYVSLGVPALTVDDNYYIKMGVSYNAKSKAEYHALLKKITSVPKPSENEILQAKKIMYLRNEYCPNAEGDPIIHLIRKYERKMGEQLREEPVWTIDNSGFFNDLMDVYKNGISDCFYMNYPVERG